MNVLRYISIKIIVSSFYLWNPFSTNPEQNMMLNCRFKLISERMDISVIREEISYLHIFNLLMLFYKLFHWIIKKISSVHLFINIYLYYTLYRIILFVYTINIYFKLYTII